MNRKTLCAALSGIACLLLLIGCAPSVAPIHHFPRFQGRATAIEWSKDCRLFAAADASGTVVVFDVAARHEIARCEGYVPHRMPYVLSGLAFSPDGTALAFGAAEEKLHVWKFQSGRTLEFPGAPGPVLSAAYSADGKRLAIASGGVQYEVAGGSPVVRPMEVVILDASSGSALAKTQVPGMVHLVFAPDASALFGTAAKFASPVDGALHLSGESMLQIWRTQPLELIGSHPGGGFRGTWSSNGRLFSMGSDVWDAQSGQLVCKTTFPIVSFTDSDRSVLTIESGVGMLRDGPLAATIWIRPLYVRLSDGRRNDLGRYIVQGGGGLDVAGSRISPDGHLAVDQWMYLWEIPR
jgi:WD40 repeat protein